MLIIKNSLKAGDEHFDQLGCSTQLPTRTYQTCRTLLLHLPEPSMSFT